MPQFHVLRCGDCEMFQVLQVTKTNKWKCKLCGQNQSIIKVFATGSGSDCRRHVQNLNRLRGEKMQALEEFQLKSLDSSLIRDTCASFDDQESSHGRQETSCEILKSSRWSNFLDNPDADSDSGLEESATSAGAGDHVTTDWVEFHEHRKSKKRGREKEWKNGFLPAPKFTKMGAEFGTDIVEPAETEDGQIGERVQNGHLRQRSKNFIKDNPLRHSFREATCHDKIKPTPCDNLFSNTRSLFSSSASLRTSQKEQVSSSSIGRQFISTNYQQNDVVSGGKQNICMKNGSNDFLAKIVQNSTLNNSDSHVKEITYTSNTNDLVSASSKWNAYLDNEDQSDDDDDDDTVSNIGDGYATMDYGKI